MILDDRCELASRTNLNTGGAASYLIGDVIPLSAVGRDVGAGEPQLYLVIQAATTATSGGAATAQFHLVSDAQAAIAVDGTATYHWSSGAVPVASLVEGYLIAVIPLPPGSYERYLGILQTTGVAALTTGKINAFFTSDVSNWRTYADAVG